MMSSGKYPDAKEFSDTFPWAGVICSFYFLVLGQFSYRGARASLLLSSHTTLTRLQADPCQAVKSSWDCQRCLIVHGIRRNGRSVTGALFRLSAANYSYASRCCKNNDTSGLVFIPRPPPPRSRRPLRRAGGLLPSIYQSDKGI